MATETPFALPLTKAFLKTYINICMMMLPGHRAPALIRCNLFHGALTPAVGISTMGEDTKPHQICLVLPLHYWLKDTALNNPSGRTEKDSGEAQ